MSHGVSPTARGASLPCAPNWNQSGVQEERERGDRTAERPRDPAARQPVGQPEGGQQAREQQRAEPRHRHPEHQQQPVIELAQRSRRAS